VKKDGEKPEDMKSRGKALTTPHYKALTKKAVREEGMEGNV